MLAAIRKGEAYVPPKKAKRSSSGGKAFADADGAKRLDPETPPQELPLREIDIGSQVSVNRSPVMILWAAVIAHEVVCVHADTQKHALICTGSERERKREGQRQIYTRAHALPLIARYCETRARANSRA